MTDPSPSDLAAHQDPGDIEIPAAVHRHAGRRHAGAASLVFEWRNELGGLTWSAGDLFYKWNPIGSGIDLQRERTRLEWLAGRHPVPRVVAWHEEEGEQLLVTTALPGRCAIGEVWKARREEAIRVIAEGLRAIHAVPIADVPAAWATDNWHNQTPESLGPRPPLDEPVLVHGDACAPNTLIDAEGRWVGHVDLGDLGVGDRWADLAVASRSLDWNFGEGHQLAFFDAYGITPDEERIEYYRALWRQS